MNYAREIDKGFLTLNCEGRIHNPNSHNNHKILKCEINNAVDIYPVKDPLAHIESNFYMQKPEFRLKSSDRQDRSVNTEFLNSEHARTIDKGFQLPKGKGRRYNLNSHNNQIKEM
jgi:hypothetical protein